MTHDDEEIWLRAYCAALGTGFAAADADATVVAYHDRWDRKHALEALCARGPDTIPEHLPARYAEYAGLFAAVISWLRELTYTMRSFRLSPAGPWDKQYADLAATHRALEDLP